MLGFSFSWLTAWGASYFERWCVDGVGAREMKGKEWKGRERKGKAGKGREQKGQEKKGKERKGRERKGKEGKGRERKGKEGKGRERKRERERKGKEGNGRDRKGQEGKGKKERKGKDGKGRERKGKKGKEREKGKGRERKGTEGTGRERKGKDGKGRERKGKEGKEMERKGKEGKERERKGKEGKERERKGKEGKERERKGKEGKGKERLIWKSAAVVWPCSNEFAWLLRSVTHLFRAQLKKTCEVSTACVGGWFGNQPPSHYRAQMSLLGYCTPSLNASVQSWKNEICSECVHNVHLLKRCCKRWKGNKPIVTQICLLSFCFWVLRPPLVFWFVTAIVPWPIYEWKHAETNRRSKIWCDHPHDFSARWNTMINAK